MSQPRRKPRQKRAQATCDVILEAAAQLFDALGYAGTTTNKIAQRAGVSVGSLYQYFPDKDAVLLALSERHMADSGATLQAVFQRLEEERPDLEGTVALLIDATVELHRHDPGLHRLLFEQTPRSPALMERFFRLEALMVAAVLPQLARLGVDGAHPRARALLMVQSLETQIHRAVLSPPDGIDPAILVAEIKALCVAALRG